MKEHTFIAGKWRRTLTVVIDPDTGERLDDHVKPTLTKAHQSRGDFVDYTKLNSDELNQVLNMPPAAQKLFWNLAAKAELGNTIRATQTAMAELTKQTQATVSKSLRELRDADLIRVTWSQGLKVYHLSPNVVWRGANHEHAAARKAWNRPQLRVIETA